MKTSAIVCAVLAGTFVFSSIASARGWRDQYRRDGTHRDGQVHGSPHAHAHAQASGFVIDPPVAIAVLGTTPATGGTDTERVRSEERRVGKEC